MLYHGTKTKIEGALKPHVTYELKNWLYATDDYLYALIRCGNFSNDEFMIREDYDYNYYELCEIVPGAFSYLFDRPGYIYIMNDKDFIHNHHTEYISKKPSMPLDCIYIYNVYEEIKNHNEIKLISYEDSEIVWKNVRGGKEGYLQRKRDYLSKIESAKNTSSIMEDMCGADVGATAKAVFIGSNPITIFHFF